MVWIIDSNLGSVTFKPVYEVHREGNRTALLSRKTVHTGRRK
jgi:hypothetical protein